MHPQMARTEIFIGWEGADDQIRAGSLYMSIDMYKLTRNSSGDKIANVNFLYDDIVHVL